MDSERDGRLFDLGEELREALGAGESIVPEHWARRFQLEVKDVEDALHALEGLRPPPASETPPPLPREIAQPTLPGDYSVLGELGRGGMGVVWRAHQLSLDRDVAVKVLMPGELVFGSALERFRREARSLARLRHRHIVQIHDVGECDGHVYFVMDLIEGESLATKLKRDGAMNAARAVRLMRQVASAMAYVHERGLVHRDLKPANILIDADGDAYVVDFGLALDRAEAVDLTLTGHLLGTPGYMAPEQIRGDRSEVGEASDVYAMGAILYECVGGRAPFAGLGLMELVQAVEHKEPRSLLRVRPSAPPALSLIAGKAMAKAPRDRYPTARALLEDLERFEAGRMVHAEPPSMGRALRTWARRHRTTLLAVILSVTVTLLALRLGQSNTRESVPALVAAARRMQADGEFASARLLLREAFETGEPLTGEELQGALLQKLLLGDDDAHACIERATAAGTVEDQDADPGGMEWRVIQLGSRHLSGELGGHEDLFQKSFVPGDGSGLRSTFDAIGPALLGDDHVTWTGFALELLETPVVAPVFIDWVRRQGSQGDRMLRTWLEDGPRSRASLAAPLTEQWRDQLFADYLSERGSTLLPVLTNLLEHPAPGTRSAALHLASTITGLPVSPWASSGRSAVLPEPLEFRDLLSRWQEATPAEWDLEILRWSRAAGLPGESPSRTWTRWLPSRFGTRDLMRPLPASADALSQRMAEGLDLRGRFDDISVQDLWNAFNGAASSRRHALHRLLGHKLGQSAGLWPMTPSGFPAREPSQLGNLWGRLIATRTGQPGMLEFEVNWAWARRTDDGQGIEITEEGALNALAGTPFTLRTTRPIEALVDRLDPMGWGLPDELPPPRLLWQPAQPSSQDAVLFLSGTIDLGLGGSKLRIEDAGGENRSDRVRLWKTRENMRGIAPGDPHPAFELWTRPARGERQDEILLVHFHPEGQGLGLRDSAQTYAGATHRWVTQASMARVLALLKDPEPKTSPAGGASSRRSGSAQRRWIFWFLGGFLAISITFGVVDGIRRALRAGFTPRSITRVGSHVILVSLIMLVVLVDPRATMPTEWVAASLALASAMAWMSVPDGANAILGRIPSALWCCATALVAWSIWFDGGTTPFAWATMLWPLGAIVGGLLLEVHAWRSGYFRLPLAAVISALLFVAFGNELLTGIVLVLESNDQAFARAGAAWLGEIRAHSWLSRAVAALRVGPLNMILFHALWWTLFPRFARMQQQRGDRPLVEGGPGW